MQHDKMGLQFRLPYVGGQELVELVSSISSAKFRVAFPQLLIDKRCYPLIDGIIDNLADKGRLRGRFLPRPLAHLVYVLEKFIGERLDPR